MATMPVASEALTFVSRTPLPTKRRCHLAIARCEAAAQLLPVPRLVKVKGRTELKTSTCCSARQSACRRATGERARLAPNVGSTLAEGRSRWPLSWLLLGAAVFLYSTCLFVAHCFWETRWRRWPRLG